MDGVPVEMLPLFRLLQQSGGLNGLPPLTKPPVPLVIAPPSAECGSSSTAGRILAAKPGAAAEALIWLCACVVQRRVHYFSTLTECRSDGLDRSTATTPADALQSPSNFQQQQNALHDGSPHSPLQWAGGSEYGSPKLPNASLMSFGSFNNLMNMSQFGQSLGRDAATEATTELADTHSTQSLQMKQKPSLRRVYRCLESVCRAARVPCTLTADAFLRWMLNPAQAKQQRAQYYRQWAAPLLQLHEVVWLLWYHARMYAPILQREPLLLPLGGGGAPTEGTPTAPLSRAGSTQHLQVFSWPPPPSSSSLPGLGGANDDAHDRNDVHLYVRTILEQYLSGALELVDNPPFSCLVRHSKTVHLVGKCIPYLPVEHWKDPSSIRRSAGILPPVLSVGILRCHLLSAVEITKLIYLKELRLSNNRLTTVPCALWTLPYLQEVWLDGNLLSSLNVGTSTAPSSLAVGDTNAAHGSNPSGSGSSTALRVAPITLLDVSFNELTTDSVKELLGCRHLFHSTLQTLNLSGNRGIERNPFPSRRTLQQEWPALHTVILRSIVTIEGFALDEYTAASGHDATAAAITNSGGSSSSSSAASPSPPLRFIVADVLRAKQEEQTKMLTSPFVSYVNSSFASRWGNKARGGGGAGKQKKNQALKSIVQVIQIALYLHSEVQRVAAHKLILSLDHHRNHPSDSVADTSTVRSTNSSSPNVTQAVKIPPKKSSTTHKQPPPLPLPRGEVNRLRVGALTHTTEWPKPREPIHFSTMPMIVQFIVRRRMKRRANEEAERLAQEQAREID